MLVLRSDCKMSRYIVEYCVTCGIVICGYPHCLNEIHILRIQHIPLCLVNPQIRLRHLWTVPYFNYKHMIFVPKWASVCVCLIHTGTFHWNSHFARCEVLTTVYEDTAAQYLHLHGQEVHGPTSTGSYPIPTCRCCLSLQRASPSSLHAACHIASVPCNVFAW